MKKLVKSIRAKPNHPHLHRRGLSGRGHTAYSAGPTAPPFTAGLNGGPAFGPDGGAPITPPSGAGGPAMPSPDLGGGAPGAPAGAGAGPGGM